MWLSGETSRRAYVNCLTVQAWVCGSVVVEDGLGAQQ
jgi:hypothetical protein